MQVLAMRVFTPADSTAFAELSGDANPMHLDPVAARRTIFGATVVHGIHLLFWALDSWFAEHPAPAALMNLRADFKHGVLHGDSVRLEVLRENPAELVLLVVRGDVQAARIQASLGPAFTGPEPVPIMAAGVCRELDFAEAAVTAGSLPVAWKAESAARLFPHVSRALPPFQIATLLTTTRLVGMECPGLHSMYSGLQLQFGPPTQEAPEIRYQVEKAEAKGSMLRLAIQGPGSSGKLITFMRPAPRRQRAYTDLAQLVTPGEFAEQRAIVIGGSRGLGEVTAKLLAAGGAPVVLTYCQGKDDAERVRTEITEAGGVCEVLPFDTAHPGPLDTPEPLTHLYYFAAPRIVSESATVFWVPLRKV